MKVLLVYCNSMLENALPVGISQLSACLKAADMEVELFDTTFYRYGEKSSTEKRIEALQFPPCPVNYKNGDIFLDFESIIRNFQPDLIGLSVVEPTLFLGMRLLDSVRSIVKKNNIIIVLGGVFTILAPETVTGYDMIDYISIGEGEKSFVELCRGIEGKKDILSIDGFWINNGGDWKKNNRPALVDIDSLPIMDFTIFHDSFLNKPMMGKLYRTISIEITRGCPYHCSYCADSSLRVLFKNSGSWYRKKSYEKLDKEMNDYVEKYHPEFVYIMSESFLAGNPDRIKGFAETYKEYSIPFWFNTRPEDINEEKIKLIKEIGCKRISIGLEHGNEVFRKKYLNRDYTNERFMKTCDILKEYDISFSVNVILGLPFETRELVFDSIEILKKVKPDGISTHIFSPYHGSFLRELSVKSGFIDEKLIADDYFQGDYCLENNDISRDEVLGLFRTIPLYIEMPYDEYSRIRKAESFDIEGNQSFESLKKEYYELKGWKIL